METTQMPNYGYIDKEIVVCMHTVRYYAHYKKEQKSCDLLLQGYQKEKDIE